MCWTHNLLIWRQTHYHKIVAIAVLDVQVDVESLHRIHISPCTWPNDWSSWFHRLMFHSWESTLQICWLPFNVGCLLLISHDQTSPVTGILHILNVDMNYKVNFLQCVRLHLGLHTMVCSTRNGVTGYRYTVHARYGM